MAEIPLFKVFMAPQATKLVTDVLHSGFIGQGQVVDKFEEMLYRRLVCNYRPVTVNSATSGIHLVLHMIKTGPNLTPDQDEILTTPLTCVATNSPILANGLKIKWVDVNKHDCNMDVDDLRRKISPRTMAIMVVHWGGYPADLDAINSVADDCQQLYGFRPKIIEDCAHAFGASYKGRLIGTRNTCVFSFQAIKHLTTGDGGMITFTYEPNDKRARLLRWYGLDRTSSNDFRCEQNITEAGFKFHMNDIAASIGLANLPFVEANIEKHRANSDFFNKELQNVIGVKLLKLESNRQSSCWVYTMLVRDRDKFIKKMKSCGIQTSRVHERNDKYSCFHESKCLLPGLDHVSDRMVCIPCGWWLSEKDRTHIVDSVLAGW